MTKKIKDVAASIHARLLNYAKHEKLNFNRVLLYYFQERFLYRLSISSHKDQLILKGGALLLTLDIEKGRPTKDIDFLSQVPSLTNERATSIIQEISKISANDGVVFDSFSLESYLSKKFSYFQNPLNFNIQPCLIKNLLSLKHTLGKLLLRKNLRLW